MRGAQAALHALTGLRSGLYEEDAIGSHPDVHVSGGPDGADSSYVLDARLVSSPRGMDELASTDRSGADFTFGEKQHDSCRSSANSLHSLSSSKDSSEISFSSRSEESSLASALS